MQTMFSGFENFADADAAVHELHAANFPIEEMNVLVAAQTAQSNLDEVNRARVHVDVTAAIGQQELTGLALLVANKQPVELQGVGRAYAAGQLATILASSTTAGAQRGDNVQSMLVTYGLPVADAAAAQKLVHNGGVLLWLRSEESRVSSVAEILRRHHGNPMIATP